MEPYYADATAMLYLGDALDVARALPESSANCIVTSPPYFGLRDYGVPGQYGLESSPAEYVETMRALFAELRRVLTDDGTLWLNLGDSYAAKPAAGREIGRLLDDGASVTEAARTVGCSEPSVRRYYPGRAWTRLQVAAWGAWVRSHQMDGAT